MYLTLIIMIMIISSLESLEIEFNTDMQLFSSEGLFFNIVPVNHCACIDINDDWFKEKFPETHQHLGLHVEYLPAYAGTIADVVNWNISSSMKLLLGYFYDMNLMQANFGNYYCDDHPGNILVNITANNSLQFFWVDPGKTDDEKRFVEDRRKQPDITEMLSFQFLRSVELLFNFMEEKCAKLEDAIQVVKRTRLHQMNLIIDKAILPCSYFPSMLKYIQLTKEENLSTVNFKYSLEELHPPSKLNESLLSKRVSVLESKTEELWSKTEKLRLKSEELWLKSEELWLKSKEL